MPTPASVEDPLRAAAWVLPDALALAEGEHAWTYAQLDRDADALAARLEARGCRPGDHVALYLPRGAFYVRLLWACWRLGLVACPLSTRTPPRGRDRLVEAAAARVLITTDAEAAGPAAVVSPADLLEGEGPPRPERRPAWEPSRPATVVFTSGSTGAPRAALHSLGNHYWSAAGSNANIAVVPGDRWLLSLPLYHVGGLAVLFRCALGRAAVVVPAPRSRLADALAAGRITHVSVVSTQLQRLLRDDGEGTDRLKAVLVGGSAVAPDLVGRAYDRGLPVHVSYGLTEMASQVATTPPGASREALRHTSGRVLPYRELALGLGDEIRVRGEPLFLGYLEGDGTVRRPTDADGWLSTGDVGAVDAEGWLRVRGRADHLFISGGENIQPEEVEEVLGALPGVGEAVVVPVPDDEFGTRPVAFVRTAPEAPFAPAAWRERLGRELPRFKIPVAFYPWPDDEGGGMKADRSLLARRAATLHGRRG